jgi:hypothetical protein
MLSVERRHTVKTYPLQTGASGLSVRSNHCRAVTRQRNNSTIHIGHTKFRRLVRVERADLAVTPVTT